MKNIIKLKAMLRIAGIVALAAAIGFSMVACGDEDGPTGGGGDYYGRLTVTGLPQGNWGVIVFPAGTDLSTFSAYFNAMGRIEATGVPNSPTIADSTLGPWRISGNREILLTNDAVDPTLFYYATVNFSNGNATVPWSIFRAVVNDLY